MELIKDVQQCGRAISLKNIYQLMQIIEVKEQDVVVCILIRKEKILITSRPFPKIFHGFYEFPGGKVHKGEFYIEALCREVKEELSIELNTKKINFLINYKITSREINLIFFICSSWKGQLKANEGQKMKWVKIPEVQKFNMLKTNRKLINFLLNSSFLFPTCN